MSIQDTNLWFIHWYIPKGFHTMEAKCSLLVIAHDAKNAMILIVFIKVRFYYPIILDTDSSVFPIELYYCN